MLIVGSAIVGELTMVTAHAAEKHFLRSMANRHKSTPFQILHGTFNIMCIAMGNR